jgi:hypothetical protein
VEGSNPFAPTTKTLSLTGHSLGYSSHSAHNVTVKSLLLVFASAEQMKQQSNCRSLLVRPAVFPIYVVGEKKCLDLFGLVIAVQKFAQTSGQKRNQFRYFAAGKLCGKACLHVAGPPIRQQNRFRVRRRFQEKRLQVTGESFQLLVDANKCLRVLHRDFAEFRDRAFSLSPPGQG